MDKKNNYSELGILGKMRSTDAVIMAVEVYKKLITIAEHNDTQNMALIYGIVNAVEARQ